MFYNCTPKKGFPDLNYLFAPFRTEHPPPNLRSPHNQVYVPRQVKVVVLNKLDDLSITQQNSFEITNQHDPIRELNETKPTRIKFSTSKLNFSDKTITEFNNHPKLKKINSAYHLKRKIATKLQNDIKTAINTLIQQINYENNFKIPLMSANTKEFRENVKNECLKEYGNLTIAKYICEDVQSERSSKRNANQSVVELIEKLHESMPEDTNLKKLIQLLNMTIVKDYYENFLGSSRYTKYLKSDTEKYKAKLSNQNFNLSEEKKKQFAQIYAEKYGGIARTYFVGE